MTREENRRFRRVSTGAAIGPGALLVKGTRIPLPAIRHVKTVRGTRLMAGHLRRLTAVLATCVVLAAAAPLWFAVVASIPLGVAAIHSARRYLAGPEHAVAIVGLECRLLVSHPDLASATDFTLRLREAVRREKRATGSLTG